MPTDDATDDAFAGAAGPLAQSTVVRTDTAGLQVGRTTIPVGDFSMPAYVARPEHGTDLPVLLVLPEAFGLHEHIADVARRFAKEGYLAIAPDLMIRQGDPKSFPDAESLVTGLLQHIPDEQVMRDLDAAVAWAATQGGDLSRLGVTGYCWGGRWAWLYAAHADITAGVAWYGILDGVGSGLYPSAELFPTHPLDVATELRGPVLGLYGGQDDAIPLDTVERMTAVLAARDADAPKAEVIVFPEAGHAFFADYRETYHRESAQQGWARALDWLRTHGV